MRVKERLSNLRLPRPPGRILWQQEMVRGFLMLLQNVVKRVIGGDPALPNVYLIGDLPFSCSFLLCSSVGKSTTRIQRRLSLRVELVGAIKVI